MPTLPTPEQQWDEPSVSGASLVPLTPYLLTDGSWRFYAATDTIPTGAVRGVVTEDANGMLAFETTGTATFRARGNAGGTVYMR